MTAEVWSIINATPDSFFTDSRATDHQTVVQMALSAVEHGASVIDLGGISTRPGHEDVTQEEELKRLSTAFKAIREVLPDVRISIDTFRSAVVESLYDQFGYFTVNDISGGEKDHDMFRIVGERELPYVMTSQKGTMNEVLCFFEKNIEKARRFSSSEIIIDPGFGFGKDLNDNFRILHRLMELKRFELRILVGISRKRMVWQTLDTTPDDALAGTTALHFELLGHGANILRVHDTLAAIHTIKIYEKYTQTSR